MKSLLIVTLVIALVSFISLAPTMAVATPRAVACGTHEKNIAEDAQKNYELGAYSKHELVQAQIAYAKAQNVCGSLSNADTCSSVSKLANDWIDGMQSAVDDGTAPPVLLDKAIVEMTALIAPCTL